MRKLLVVMLVLILLVAGLFGYGMLEARRDPVVRTATLLLPGWPAGAKPVRAVLISDVHIGSWAMDAGRLTRIVDQINALKPDIVFIAGDMINGHAANSAATIGEAMVAPLSRLKAPLGVVAMLGNHDNWTGAAAVRGQLERAGITVLENQAIARGPLAIGVIGDRFSYHSNIPATVTAMEHVSGGRLFLTHSPSIFPLLPDGSVLLAGHTHCGQVRIFGWSPGRQPYDKRYRCGVVREGKRIVVVTGGLGTSGPPIRIGEPPDLWLLTLGP
ncbi:metallophosphoesterase [Sphingomonas panacisoli]|uniref:Metallophosphoesterase n=1 Tax=Sphingomonas panacisoli TaxID=1813879 RepID=A0A5B8LEC9_9SPHN|nr:metallophosphoesterase [Sphingomonas panacisoli]QDZ06104.1 metallophosphoesterase [Sphingomonas panacisoli]